MIDQAYKLVYRDHFAVSISPFEQSSDDSSEHPPSHPSSTTRSLRPSSSRFRTRRRRPSPQPPNPSATPECPHAHIQPCYLRFQSKSPTSTALALSPCSVPWPRQLRLLWLALEKTKRSAYVGERGEARRRGDVLALRSTCQRCRPQPRPPIVVHFGPGCAEECRGDDGLVQGHHHCRTHLACCHCRTSLPSRLGGEKDMPALLHLRLDAEIGRAHV